MVVRGPANSILTLSPKHRCKRGRESAVTSNEAVPHSSHGCKAGNVVVTPESEPAPESRPVAEHPKYCFRTAGDGPVGLDQVNSRVKTLDRYVLSKTRSDRLEGGDIHFFARGFLASPDPADAKEAVRIIEEQRLFSRRRAVSQPARATNLGRVLISLVAHSSHDSL